MMRTASIAAAAMVVAGPALAQQILRAEPPAGGLRTGEVVLVDNGRCPKGQIMKVTGSFFAGGRNSASGPPRQRECVPRPGR